MIGYGEAESRSWGWSSQRKWLVFFTTRFESTAGAHGRSWGLTNEHFSGGARGNVEGLSLFRGLPDQDYCQQRDRGSDRIGSAGSLGRDAIGFADV